MKRPHFKMQKGITASKPLKTNIINCSVIINYFPYNTINMHGIEVPLTGSFLIKYIWNNYIYNMDDNISALIQPLYTSL